jgi:hypothetical protein
MGHDLEMPQLPREPPFGTSLARQVARQNLTKFNHAFWVPERARTHLRSGFASIVFPSPGPGVHGVYNTATEWQGASDVFLDWTRQQVLISAVSLLEVYINSIATTALQANPEFIDRSLKGKDGYAFVLGKATPPKGLEKTRKAAVEGFTKGSWKERFRRLEIVFGKLPEKLVDLESDLQNLQNKRNKIAHKFGADEARSVPWDAVTHVAVGPKCCENAIKTVSKFITVADSEVFAPLVGAHEVLEIYHNWAGKNPGLGRLRLMDTQAEAFCKHIGRLIGQGLGREYAQSIINYYDAL